MGDCAQEMPEFGIMKCRISVPNVKAFETTTTTVSLYCFCFTDVAEGDPDSDCRSLAVQSLVLLDKNLKKQLEDPQALSLKS